MTTTLTPERSYRSGQPVGRDGFAQSLHAEWTKFRTVRGWVIAAVSAALIIMILALVTAQGSHASTCINGTCTTSSPRLLLGPTGEAVSDHFYFVHQPLAGDGSITARVTSMTGLYSPHGGVQASAGPNGRASTSGMEPGLQPWSKAGVIIKAGTAAGSVYAAMMITGSHGVRMQANYTHDVAGPADTVGNVSAASPRWLRLARTGSTITGSESADGSHWTTVGAVHLPGLGSSAQAGVFAASPEHTVSSTHLGGGSQGGGPTLVNVGFDNVSVQGTRSGASWAGVEVGAGQDELPGVGYQQRGSARPAGFTVSGTGDIAPDVNTGTPVEQVLVGAFAGLLIVIVLATLFMTSEYRRGMIRTTFAANPRRGRVLAAKAVVLAAVTFLAGLIGSAISLPIGQHLLRSNGNTIYPTSTVTDLRLIIGTGALLAVVAVLALSVATVLRRAAGAVTLVAAVVVLPYLLAVAFILPAGPAGWLLRVTPAAGFAIQQSVTQYPQVSANYSPANGYYPLAPWAGFAVLCAWTVLAFSLAAVVLRRRDA